MRVKTYEEILETEDKYILVDVRTPREFRKSTIPGAINIPLFNDEEYERVGTLYKKLGKQKAIVEALELVGPKIKELYLQFYESFERDKEFVVFCARGGLRSSCVVNFISNFSLSTIKLDGGYKKYRNHVNQTLPQLFSDKSFIALYGNTGCGKTKILTELDKQGYDVLDLEKCANHRGSLLGSIGLGVEHSQKMFESLVYDMLRNSESDLVYTEGESRRIGHIIMPTYMFEVLKGAKKIVVTTSIENRVEIIKSEYLSNTCNDEIITQLNKLRKYTSNKQVDEYITNVKASNYDIVIKDLIENYYDKKYKSNSTTSETTIEFKNILDGVNKILAISKESAVE